MFHKILVANRGEIAVRIIRACKELGIATVAIYSEADKEALHTKLADEAVCIGPYKSSESYLDIKRVISAAVITGATAIHPGFGFLSENAKFAKVCEESNITFIGPTGEMMEKMGDKANARATMIANHIPVVPGSEGILKDIETAKEVAEEIGYPVIIKASAGGGGKGMRIAYTKEEVIAAFDTAKREAKSSFGDDAMYMEKYIVNPKHIEIQILADSFGNTVHLFERDCSMQRRHQKILEEAPSATMSNQLREKMGEVAIKAAKAIHYKNAGTIEFIIGEDEKFYFMEMNTRIQVEHPITEMITGIDIIKKQIEIAAGLPLDMKQEDIVMQGHSIECRINAENPEQNFRPSPGKITDLHVPGGKGIRIDSAIYNGYTVSPYYDSMLAKLIVHGKDREEAIDKMTSALEEMVVEGIDTNIGFHYELLMHEKFIDGSYNTGLIGELLRK